MQVLMEKVATLLQRPTVFLHADAQTAFGLINNPTTISDTSIAQWLAFINQKNSKWGISVEITVILLIPLRDLKLSVV
jgi:hypothetical protein